MIRPKKHLNRRENPDDETSRLLYLLLTISLEDIIDTTFNTDAFRRDPNRNYPAFIRLQYAMEVELEIDRRILKSCLERTFIARGIVYDNVPGPNRMFSRK